MVKLNRYTGNWAHCLAKMARPEISERLITAREGMQEMIKQGVDADISGGSLFPENVNYVKGKVLWTLAEYNPQIPYAEPAAKANRKGEYFQLTHDVKMQGKPASQLLLEIAEADAIKPVYKRKILDSKRKETFSIPANRLGEIEEAVFLARGEKLARDYGQWVYDALKDLWVENPTIEFCVANSQKQDFSAGFWLCGADTDGMSYFDGSDRGLDSGDGCLFGVREKSAEGASKKFLSCTPADLRLAERNYKRLQRLVQPEALRGLGTLLEKLRQ